jgi:hypothetical protein
LIRASYLSGKTQEECMNVTQEPTKKNSDNDAIGAREPKIDRNAPAGSKNSLGAESVRDGRPSTDDSVVEAMDEEGPGIVDQ